MEEQAKSASAIQIEERRERIEALKNFARNLTIDNIVKLLKKQPELTEGQIIKQIEGIDREWFFAFYLMNLVQVKRRTLFEGYYDPLRRLGFFVELNSSPLSFRLSDEQIKLCIAKYRERLGD